jgi:SAM-dependent methyltransferase
MTLNDGIYELNKEEGVVRDYANRDSLQLPEKTILKILAADLRGSSILDVGVGGGRTTPYLAPLAESYIGIDISSSMIAACRSKWPAISPKIRFETLDVCNMNGFGRGSFDFVFFTHNGLDCLTQQGRLEALSEIKRVLRPQGVFVFSSHDLRFAKTMFSFIPKSGSVKERLRHVVANRRLRKYNPGYRRFVKGSYAVIRDGCYDFRIGLYYVDPHYQLEQLRSFGFGQIRVFSYITGAEFDSVNGLPLCNDPWLYYIATLSNI